MDLMIDANIAVDVFTKREPFFESSKKILALCTQEGTRGILWSGSITTIHYILQKPIGKVAAREHVRTLLALYEIANVTKGDILDAEESEMPDFEDAVIAYCAKRAKADVIVTRNTKHFAGSPVPAITPDDFLKKHST